MSMENSLTLNKKKSVWKRIKSNVSSYAMVAPFGIFFILFWMIPVIGAILLSFTSFNMLELPVFVGLGNYERMLLEDDVFFTVLKNTIIFAVVTGPLGYILSFFFAWLINDMGRILRPLFTFFFYAPTLAGSTYMVWNFLFSNNQYGFLNGTLMNLGLISEPVKWLSDQGIVMYVIIIVQLWLSLGTGFLAFIAGFQSMDKSLFEAGAIDGVKNRWQELRYITVPQMAPQLMFSAVMQISATFAVGDIIMLLAGAPTTNYAADVLVTYMKDLSTVRFELGYACTVATFLFILMIVLNNIITTVLRKYSTD